VAPPVKKTGRNENLTNAGRGRPPGVLNKVTREIKTAAKAIVEDMDYVDSLKRRVKAGRAPHMETLLFHYAYGKPKETVKHEGGDGGPLVTRVIHTFTDDAADGQ
jgi:hypothetical protein